MDEVEKLIQRLERPGKRDRAKIAMMLGELRDARAVPALIEAMKDKDDGVRVSVSDALGMIGGTAVVPALIEALGDVEEDVRYNAYEYLIGIGEPALGPLVTLLVSGAEDSRKIAAQAIKRIGLDKLDEGTRITYFCMNGGTPTELSYIVGLGERAIPDLMRILGGDDLDMVKKAAHVLIFMAERTHLSLPEVLRALIESEAISKLDENGRIHARRWAGETYCLIAKGISKKKLAEMPGEMLMAKVPKPKGESGLYRTIKRVSNG